MENRVQIEHVHPSDIEKTSFGIIHEELQKLDVPVEKEKDFIITRVIHTSADFDYAHTMFFSEGAERIGVECIKKGCHIVTDTTMVLSGINKKNLKTFGGDVHCFIADTDVAEKSRELGITRSAASMMKASELNVPLVFAIGNAPTALIELRKLIDKGFRPELIIGVPVGFVNVVAAKQMIMETGIPCIVNRGRKGGSNIAAAICNALIYKAREEDGQ